MPDRLRAASSNLVSLPYEIDGQQVNIGTSVGIAIGPGDGLNPDALMRNADLALYRAKEDGRGAFRFFEPEMDAQMQERRSMEVDLRRALAAGQFELHYQPIVNLGTNEISAFEALIRWHHPTKGLIAPNTFIPLAEEIGFIVPLGEWVMRQACTTAATWPGDVKVAVNLSPVQFRSPGLVQVVVGALAASGLPPDRLELEITETILLQDNESTLNMLYQLRELGVMIAMDDFGTGYSSLSYLQSFPFDRIKIDRSFVKDIGEGVGSHQHCSRSGGHGQGSGHGDDGRGRGDAGAARFGPVRGLHRNAGLPLQQAAACRGHCQALPGAAQAADAGRGGIRRVTTLVIDASVAPASIDREDHKFCDLKNRRYRAVFAPETMNTPSPR